MIDIVVTLIVLAIILPASIYIYRAKKNGRKCIGCPDSKNCAGSCPSCLHDKK